MQETRTKKAATTFVIQLVGGPGLRPWNVPIGALGRIFNAVQRLIAHAEKEEWPEGESTEESPGRPASTIQLLDVISASAAYPFAAVDGTSALKVLGEMGRNLSNPSRAEWDTVSLSSIDDISAAARAIGVTVEIRREKKDGEVLAKITPHSYTEVSGEAFIVGESSVFGCLERVGGTTEMRCALRLPDQAEKMVYCRVETEELIRQLGQHIYENIRVSGTVTWLRRGWRVKTIHIKAFDRPKSGSVLEALDRIYEAGGKAWDDIEDPDAFVAEMRQA